MRRSWAAGAAIVMCLGLGGVPAVAQSPAPSGAGLPGSLWHDTTDGQDVFYVIHPDGTLVSFGPVGGRAAGFGVGVWEPTGERSLTSTLVHLGGDATTTHQATWEMDEAAETATLTRTTTVEREDGSSVTDETATDTLERLHLAPMPEEARWPTPPEPAWSLGLGPAIHLALGPTLLGVCKDPAGFYVIHADGTGITVSTFTGQGVTLWAPTGPLTLVSTGWYPRWHLDPPAVVEWLSTDTGSGFRLQYGTSNGFEGSAIERIIGVVPIDQPLPETDPAWWPPRGAVWVEQADDGPVTHTAYLADGTVVSLHPDYGIGVGPWRPTGPDTFASTIWYRDGRVQLRAESTVSADGETLTSRFALLDPYPKGDVQTGTSTATRMHVGP
jgi:hypothetical protein